MAFAPSFTVLVGILALASLGDAKGTLCSSHPLYKPGQTSQIIRSWEYASQEDNGRMYWTRSAYLPQYKQHAWVPLGDQASTKYANLDYFTSYTGRKATDNFVTLHFQRQAKLYLLIHAYVRNDPPATLTGWKSEGWITRKDGSPTGKAIIGIGARKEEMYAPSRAYVFSKVGTDIVIPDAKWLAANIRGITVKGYFSALIAEANGLPVTPPASPAGTTVTPGERCPDALHAAWKAKGTDAEDPQTRNMYFETWHPLWDPCYWCAYDHEHGSAAKLLMGYGPRYGYTALKNNLQDESKKGFKDIVVGLKGYHLYYGVHAHMSKGSRFDTRFHTLAMAVTKKGTNELMLELRFKADYGLRSTRLAKNKGQMPLTPADQKLYDEQEKGYKPRLHRLVNVINPGMLDPRFKYRDPPNVLHGNYEQWATAPICSYTARWKEPTVDFKNMGLALRTPESKGRDTVKLGRTRDGVFHQQPSTNRELRGTFSLSDELCVFKLPDIMGKSVNGKFYTDPYGTKLLPGPAPNAIGQYIKPGFSIDVSGVFETADTWLGLHEDGKKGSFQNIGYAIDTTEN